MNDNEASLAMFDQAKLKPDVRHAALATAHAILSREGITAAAAVRAYGVDLLLAEGLEPEERTDEHFREHGASMKACEAYYVARDAAAAEIAKLDPANSGFKILFSLAA
jgi:hypothetical protein